MYDKLYTINVGGLLTPLTKLYGSDKAGIILTCFVDSIVSQNTVSMSNCITATVGVGNGLQATLFETNNAQHINDLIYNISVIQQADIIFSWQLCRQVLFFNMGKRHGTPGIHN